MRCRFEVTGRVQGVGFRAHARAEAERLGLVGYVENRADGAVVGEADGEPEALGAFAVWLRRGPTFARVDALVWEDTRDAQREAAFTIRR
jgi:acylphosphatase